MLYLICTLAFCTVAITVGRFALLEFRRDRIPLLIYHRVVADDKIHLCRKSAYVISQANFEKQMLFLKGNGFTPMDLNDFLYYKEHKSELPQKPVVLTFDDGYENNYLYAFPILKRLGFKAVIYSVSDPSADFFNGFEFPERLMTEAQMKELSENGISIQGHTATHVHLKYLSDEGIEKELTECKATLERITQKPVIHMAIPFGSWDKRLRSIAKRTGYQTLAVPGKGTNNLDTRPFDLRRLSIHKNTSMDEFKRILTSPLYSIIGRLYASAHLAIRYSIGQKYEKKVKILFASLKLDNPLRLAKFVAAVFALIVFAFVLIYLF